MDRSPVRLRARTTRGRGRMLWLSAAGAFVMALLAGTGHAATWRTTLHLEPDAGITDDRLDDIVAVEFIWATEATGNQVNTGDLTDLTITLFRELNDGDCLAQLPGCRASWSERVVLDGVVQPRPGAARAGIFWDAKQGIGFGSSSQAFLSQMFTGGTAGNGTQYSFSDGVALPDDRRLDIAVATNGFFNVSAGYTAVVQRTEQVITPHDAQPLNSLFAPACCTTTDFAADIAGFEFRVERDVLVSGLGLANEIGDSATTGRVALWERDSGAKLAEVDITYPNGADTNNAAGPFEGQPVPKLIDGYRYADATLFLRAGTTYVLAGNLTTFEALPLSGLGSTGVSDAITLLGPVDGLREEGTLVLPNPTGGFDEGTLSWPVNLRFTPSIFLPQPVGPLVTDEDVDGLLPLDDAFASVPLPGNDALQLANDTTIGVDAFGSVYQTLTVQQDGELAGVVLALDPGNLSAEPGTITVEILPLVDDAPFTAGPLAQVDVDPDLMADPPATPTALDEFGHNGTYLDLSSAGVTLQAGQVLAVMVNYDGFGFEGTDNLRVGRSSGDSYLGGSAFQDAGDGDAGVDLGFDLAFRLLTRDDLQPTLLLEPVTEGPFSAIEIDEAGRLATFAADDANGNAQATIQAVLSEEIWARNTVDVVVNPVNDPPVATGNPPFASTINEDQFSNRQNNPALFDSFFTDVDGDALTYLTATPNSDNPGLMTSTILYCNGSTCRSTPNVDTGHVTPRHFASLVANQSGVANLSVRVVDAAGEAVDAVVQTFTVNPVNDAPVVVNPVADINLEVGDGFELGLGNVFDDVDIATSGDSLTLSLIGNSDPDVVSASGSGTLLILSANSVGTSTLVVQAADQAGATVTDSILVTVAPPPVQLIANDDTAGTEVGIPVSIDVLANDEGIDELDFDIFLDSAVTGGDVELNEDNSFLFTPAPDFAGVASFTYALEESIGCESEECDGGQSDTALVQILVNATPVAVDDNAGDTPINTPLRRIEVLANDLNLQDTELEGAEPTITIVNPGNARVLVNPDFSVYYEPLPGFFGIDTFTYTVGDPDGDTSDPATVTVQVTATSGIPGPNVNIVGPTPDNDFLFPDTGLRQQNEVACGMRADNPLHLFCGFNDYRGADDERVGDGWQGVATSRDGGLTWRSRLAPGWRGYPGGALHPDVRFAADPTVASAPGVMFFGFIASDRANKGPGGLYLQRWWENPTHIGYAWLPEAQTLNPVAGKAADATGPSRFIDKDHMVFFPTTNNAAPVVLNPVVEGTDGGSQLGSRSLPAGTLAMTYAVFDGSDRSSLDFEQPAFTPDASVDGQQGFSVSESDAFGNVADDPGDDVAVVELDPLAAADPERHNLALRILPAQASAHVERAGLFQLPVAPAKVVAGFNLLLSPNSNNGLLSDLDIATPFANVLIRDGVPSVEPAGPLPAAGSAPQQGGGGSSNQPLNPVAADSFHRLRFEATLLTAGASVNVFLGNEQIAGPMPFDPGATDNLHLRVTGGGTVFIDAISVDRPTDADIQVVTSNDYGDSFSAPVTVSGTDRVNQGAYLAANGDDLLVVWRRFNDPLNPDTGQTDAILWNHSSDRGVTWSGPQVLADNICPFDQSGNADAFRSRAFPVAVHDGSTFQVFWSSRGFAPNAANQIDCFSGPARIVASSLGSSNAWSAPVVVDPIPTNSGRHLGHQFMPAAFAARGLVQLSWYDSRDDASASFGPLINDEQLVDPGSENLLLLRHTLDVRTLRWDPANPVPSNRVTQMRFGLLPIDTNGDGVPDTTTSDPVPVERFYANGRIFRKGTQPFLGDYIAVTGPAWRQAPDGTWSANNGPAAGPGQAPSFFTAWADNRDLRGDVWEDLDAPTQYVRQSETGTDGVPDGQASTAAPEGAAELLAAAPGGGEGVGISDPPAAVGQCNADEPLLTLTRNQNVYGAMIQPGFRVSTPAASRTNRDIQRAYVLYLQNFTNQQRSFLASIENQPTPVATDDPARASFSQLDGDPQTALTVTLPPRSSAARTVYVTSEADFPAVEVSVLEQQCEPSLCQGDAIILGVGSTAATGTASELHRPQVGQSATNVRTPGFENFDVEHPGFENPGFENPGFENPGFENPGFENPGFENPGFENPGFENPGFENPGFENVLFQNPGFENPGFENPGFENPGFENPGFENPGFENPGFENPGFENASPPTISYTALANDGIDNPLLDGVDGLEVVETVWPVTNGGNVISSFNLSPFVAADLSAVRSQLLVTRTYAVPTVRECQIVPELRHQVLVNIVDPFLGGVDTVPEGADQQGTDASLVSVFIQPGETLLVTLRVFREPGEPEGTGGAGDVRQERLGIAVIPQSCDTGVDNTCEPESGDPEKQPKAAVEGVHPVMLAFQAPVNADLVVQTGRQRIDRRSRTTLLPFTVRNTGSTAYVGKLRVAITSNGAVANADGVSSTGLPVINLLNSNTAVLPPGAVLTGQVLFARGAPRRLTVNIDVQVKSASP